MSHFLYENHHFHHLFYVARPIYLDFHNPNIVAWTFSLPEGGRPSGWPNRCAPYGGAVGQGDLAGDGGCEWTPATLAELAQQSNPTIRGCGPMKEVAKHRLRFSVAW
jgi:hypothetical protein